MPADEDTPRRRRSLDKGRMESFSDGIFGFAATLLVIGIVLHPPGTPLHQVLGAWPAFVAYMISFLTIGAAWLAHTGLTDRLAQTDSILLRLNLLLLLMAAFNHNSANLNQIAKGCNRGDAFNAMEIDSILADIEENRKIAKLIKKYFE